MHLKTSFRASTKKMGKRETSPRSGAVTCLISPLPKHANNPMFSSPDQSFICQQETERLDVFLEERSSQSQGMRRLRIVDAVRLLVGAEVRVVVPPTNKTRVCPHI